MTFATVNRTEIGETNGLVNGLAYHNARGKVRTVQWTAPGLYVTRLRLLGDPGYPYLDVSYCHGMIGDEHVDVQLPFSDLPVRGHKHQIVKCAIKDGVNAKKMGLLDNISILR